MRISIGWVKAVGIILIGCALVIASVSIDEKISETELEEADGEARERYDKPGEAAQFYRLKRLPEGETEMPIERYLVAQEKMRDLPIYSSVHNRLFPSRRALMSSAPDIEPALSTLPTLLDGWKSLGPGNVGGRTRALLVHPSNPDVIYAGAAAGGVWKTADGGKNWRPLGDLLPNLAVNALAMDPANPDVIYAGTGEGYFNADAVRGAGIFQSFDGGNTWRRLDGTGTRDFYYVNDIVVSPTRGNRIYAATQTGVMRSLDGGSTWTRVLDPDRLNGGCLDLAIRTDQPKDYVFAACGTATGSASPASVQSAVYRNTDAAAGLTGWEVVYTEPGMGRTSIAIAPSNQDVV
ncbi:MAG: WD40/YVTN/BNR-like repeat-containing protein, partial [Gammaproteobacteria bacterium]